MSAIDDVLNAVYAGDEAAVQKYLASGGDLNAANARGFTPLLVAMEGRHPKLAVKLLQQGADAKVQLPGGFTALHVVCKQIRNRPRNFRVTVTRDGKEVTLTDPDEIRRELGSHPDDEYREWLELARELLVRGVDVDVAKSETNQRALRDAAEASDELVGLILDHAKPDVSHGDNEGMTALHMAARAGHRSAVERLLDAGANPNAGDNYGFTPLHEALLSGHAEVVKLLLARGADPTQELNKDYPPHSKGDDAAAIAKASRHPELAKLLTAARPKVVAKKKAAAKKARPSASKAREEKPSGDEPKPTRRR